MEACPALFAAAGTDRQGEAATDRQREQELIRLHALVDGLAAHPLRLRVRPQRR